MTRVEKVLEAMRLSHSGEAQALRAHALGRLRDLDDDGDEGAQAAFVGAQVARWALALLVAGRAQDGLPWRDALAELAAEADEGGMK